MLAPDITPPSSSNEDAPSHQLQQLLSDLENTATAAKDLDDEFV